MCLFNLYIQQIFKMIIIQFLLMVHKRKFYWINPHWVSTEFHGFPQYSEQLHIKVKAKETDTLW